MNGVIGTSNETMHYTAVEGTSLFLLLHESLYFPIPSSASH